MRSKIFLALGACLALFAWQAAAQNWPSKQITLVVATTPGGSLDLVARVMATHLERGFGRLICAPAALLEPPVQVRGDRSEAALALVFTALLRLGEAPVGGRCSDVLELVGWICHVFS